MATSELGKATRSSLNQSLSGKFGYDVSNVTGAADNAVFTDDMIEFMNVYTAMMDATNGEVLRSYLNGTISEDVYDQWSDYLDQME